MEYKKDARGYYRANVPKGTRDAKGVPQYKVVRAKTIAELRELIKRAEAEIASGAPDKPLTVADWYEKWITVYKSDCKETTKIFYQTMYKKHIHNEIGTRYLSEIRELDCQAVLNKLTDNNLSEKTVKDVRSILFSLFDTAKRNHYVSENAAQCLTAKGRPPKSRRALTAEEREKYLAACKDVPFGLYAAFLYWFGLRRGECLALRKDDIRSDGIHIEKQILYPHNNEPVLELTTKSDAGNRIVPISNAARKYIDFDNLPDGYLFCNADGSYWSYSQFCNKWNTFIQNVFGKETEITPHYLRHNFATMLCESNVPLLAIKTICGHEDIQTTMSIYQHYTESIQTKATDIIANLGDA